MIRKEKQLVKRKTQLPPAAWVGAVEGDPHTERTAYAAPVKPDQVSTACNRKGRQYRRGKWVAFSKSVFRTTIVFAKETAPSEPEVFRVGMEIRVTKGLRPDRRWNAFE